MQTFPKVGLDALLTPENCAVLLIDHQPSQLANVNSHEPTMVINNVIALAKTAKAFGIPTILTTINANRGGEILKQLQAVFPDQTPIDRTSINSWEDRRVVEAVKNTGRKKLVGAALWSEMSRAARPFTRWATATTCTPSPTRRAAFLRKRMTWQSAELSPQEPNRLPGSRWLENCSAIGRALNVSAPSRRSCSTMPARQAPCWRGSWPTKHSAGRAFH
jgi:hypothetical protein